MRTFTTETEAATRKIAQALGAAAKPGDVLALVGPLGAGKTTFTQGFAKGAGFKGSVVSPSFGLARRYKAGTRVIHHLDLYRLADRDLPNLALDEYFDDPRAICVVEWPEIADREMPSDRLEIRFEHGGEGVRTLSLVSHGPRSERMLRALKK